MSKRSSLFTVTLLLLATAAVYLPSIDGEFVFDDILTIGDPLVASPMEQGATTWIASPRPLVMATFALNRAVAGLDTRSWHITNVLVHLVAILLAWRVALRLLSKAGLTSPEVPAIVAAALFALHPLQTESVSYITQRAESLASVLYLAGLLVLLTREEATERARRTWLLVGAGALELAGLLVKPIVATLPFAWLLITALLPNAADRELTASRTICRRWAAALPLVALSIAAAVHGILGSGGSLHAGYAIPGLDTHRYVATQLRAIPVYLRLLTWPREQSVDWYFPVSSGLMDPAAIAGGAFLTAMVAGALLLAAKVRNAPGDGPAAARVFGFGVPFFLLVLAPSSSVVPLRDPLVEHRVYLASLGLFVAAAAVLTVAIRRLGRARAKWVGAAIAVTLIFAAGAATLERNRIWADPLTLYQNALVTSAQKARVQENLGQALYNVGRGSDALSHFRRARDLASDGSVTVAQLTRNIIVVLLTLGRPAEARDEVRALLAESSRNPEALALLANVEFVSGRAAETEAAALTALALDPQQLMALKYLGMIRAQRGDLLGALGPLRAAAAQNPVDPMVFVHLGEVEEGVGNQPEACRAYARGAELPLLAVYSRIARDAMARLGCR